MVRIVQLQMGWNRRSKHAMQRARGKDLQEEKVARFKEKLLLSL
jgi:hypothetical protein